MRHITPLLRVDESAVEPDDADEAFTKIKLGEVATVADDVEARLTLLLLRVRQELVADRIHFSHTGEPTVEG